MVRMLRGKIRVVSDDPSITDLMYYSRGVYNPVTKVWIAPNSPKLLWALHNKGFVLNRDARNVFKEYRKMELPEHLYHYQKQGVRRLEYYGGVCLLADDMGLGKTIQLLTWWDITNRLPAVIVCPAYLRLNWVKEITKWTKLKYQLITDGETKLQKTDVYIISYNLLGNYKKQFGKLRIQAIAADEAHYIKSPKVARSKAFKFLSRKIQSRILMTGTPVTNRTAELWNLLNILNPTIWKNKRDFNYRYCDPRKGSGGYIQFKGSTNIPELVKKIKKTGYIRRTKEQVLKDLPPKTRIVIPLELTNKKTYSKADNDIINYYKDAGLDEKAINAEKAKHLMRLNELKQLSAAGKMSGVEKYINDKMEEGYHILVFGLHKAPLKKLHSKYKKSGLIIGGTSHKKRNQYEDDFQAGLINPLFGNIASMGTGLNLTKATLVVFFEFPWNPALIDQAEDRAHRNGQKDNVTVAYLVGLNSIDEPLVEMIDEKRIDIKQIFDRGVVKENDDIVTQLLKKYAGLK